MHDLREGLRVLIIDDDALWRRVAREMLTRSGYTVVGEAFCGKSAIELVRRLAPDAVVLDVRLPDTASFEVAAALAALPCAPAVLLTSAGSALLDSSTLQYCGARGFVRKEDLAGIDLHSLCASSASPDLDDASDSDVRTIAIRCPDLGRTFSDG